MAVKELRYTPDSLRLRDLIKERLAQKLSTVIRERFAREDRGSVVTETDVKAAVLQAMRLVLDDLKAEGLVGPDTKPPGDEFSDTAE